MAYHFVSLHSATTVGTGGDWSPELWHYPGLARVSVSIVYRIATGGYYWIWPELSGWGTNNVLFPLSQLSGRSFQKARNFRASSHQNAEC